MNPKIAMVCLTFNRPKELGRIIECFRRQTYENRELVILDDLGQYPDQPTGDRWRIVSVPDRYPSLGQKRNAAVKLISPDVTMLQTIDDDDIYLGHSLEAAVHALQQAPWAQGREAFEWDGETMTRHETWHRDSPGRFAYNGHWCFRVKEFWEVGGYPTDNDDDAVWRKMFATFGQSVDLLSKKFPDPAYVYSRDPSTRHISWLYGVMSMNNAWDNMAHRLKPAGPLVIGWDREYDKIPRPTKAEPRAW